MASGVWLARWMYCLPPNSTCRPRSKSIPGICPACDSAPVSDGAFFRCPNSECPGTAGKKLHDALVRLGIENIGPGTVAKLVDAGFNEVDRVLDMTYDNWKALPGFAALSADKALREVKRIKEVEDYRILACLNLEGVGLTLSKKIMDKMTLVELRTASLSRIAELDGIGTVRAEIIVDGLKEKTGLITALLMRLVIKETKGQSSRPTVVFTGKSEVSRDEWFRRARARGYEPLQRVVKGLTLLVTNSLESETSKMKVAKKNGTRITTYGEWEDEAN
jgi:NAD-dependent DNA ligase